MNAKNLIVILLLLSACVNSSKKPVNPEEFDFNENRGNELLAVNASQYGVKYTETFVLMQNRMGIRIEFNLDRSNLQLWISPQAGKSMDYRDRNWSNREDHTNIFDCILIPNLKQSEFIRCDYDAFHSVLYYQNQTLHIASAYDKPAVLIWFEEDDVVDFKSDKSDELLKQESNEFSIKHHDRGRNFGFSAVLGAGGGVFRHNRDFDEGRSIYARANISANQLLVISGELLKENSSKIASELAQQGIDNILNDNENKIATDLQFGKFNLKNRDEMQKLMDVNRRMTLSMQDKKGFMRSTNKYIYYLLWYRDGGMNTSHLAYTGWVEPARHQAGMAILNPNISKEEPEGIFYGQVMSGPLTKWEEDGLYYVVWPVFLYWTQTGDKTFCEGKYLENMEAGMDWLERQCYDEEKGLFGRYHYCETPLENSRGYGWDDAVGKPTDYWPTTYDDKTIVRSYDIYMNLLNYNIYIMLSAMEEGEEAEEYMQKAKTLERNMMPFFNNDKNLPSYGDLLTEGGELIMAEPYGLDRTDYVWSLSVPAFTPTLPERYNTFRKQMYNDLTTEPTGHFLCAYNAFLTSMDNEIYNEDSIMAALDYLVPQSVRPGKYLPMPYTIPEIINVVDGHPFHDVRPIVYSAAPWFSAVTGLGVRRLPFGIAVRGTKYLESIEKYEFKNSLIYIEYSGEGEISSVVLNGNKLRNTYQIPEKELQNGSNKLIVNMSKDSGNSENLLVSSTVILSEVQDSDNILVYNISAFGKNVLVFKNLSADVVIADANNVPVQNVKKSADNLTWIEFEGRGDFSVRLENI